MSIWWKCCGTLSLDIEAIDEGYGIQETSSMLTSRTIVGIQWISDTKFTCSGYVVFDNVLLSGTETITLAKLTASSLHQSVPSISNDIVTDYVPDGTHLCRWNYYGEDIDDAAEYTTYSGFSGATRTTASVTGSATAVVSGSGSSRVWDYDSADEWTSPDLSAIIQEIIDRAGWSSGNALQIFFDENGSDFGSNTPDEEWGMIADLRDSTTGTLNLYIEYTA